MREVQLSRSGADRRRYEIDGIGWLRSVGLLRLRAEAGDSGGQHWAFEPRGWAGHRAEALDGLSGLPVAEYRRTAKLSHGGMITWRSREYHLGPASRWRQRYAISLGEEQLAEIAVKGRGKQPVTLYLAPALETEPGLVLFACWLCQGFVTQSSASA